MVYLVEEWEDIARYTPYLPITDSGSPKCPYGPSKPHLNLIVAVSPA